MNILHISHSNFIGGAAIAASRLNQALNLTIHSKMCVGLYNNNENIYPFHKSKTLARALNFIRYKLGIIIQRLLGCNINDTCSLNIVPSYYHRKINSYCADLVHIHWVGHELISIGDISKINTPLVWTLHDFWPISSAYHYPSNSSFLFSNYLYTRKINLLIKKNILLIAPTNFIKNEILKLTPNHKLNIAVIPNAIDINFWRPTNNKKNKNIKKILFGVNCNYFDNRKGLDRIINKLESFHSDVYEIQLHLFGSDINPKIIKNLKYYNHGYLSENNKIKRLYDECDIFLMPSRIETFGQTAVEAMAMGLPVIAFNNTGVSDLIIHKKTGWLANDADDFMVGLNFFLDASNYDSEVIREYVCQNFSYEIIAEKHKNIYKKIIQK